VFGNVPRARISSQCIKRSQRRSDLFRDGVGLENLGVRTRRMPSHVGEMLVERGYKKELADIATNKLTVIGKSADKEGTKGETEQVLFYSHKDLQAICEFMAKEIDVADRDVGKFSKTTIKETKKVLEDKRPVTIDIAMFGRMVTDTIMHDVEAAVQVAHAISTNRLEREFDYFTAVDDLIEESDEVGAGMIGDVEFNSSCFYHYANIHVDELRKNLTVGRLETEAIDILVNGATLTFLEAFAMVNPSGKQNTFASHALPSAILVTVKDRNIPVNLANAFVKPAEYRKEKDLVTDSIEKLVCHADKVNSKFFTDEPGVRHFWFSVDDVDGPKDAEVCNTFKALKAAVANAMTGV